VGYHVRLDNAVNADTQLLFCTTGILLRRSAKGGGDPLVTSWCRVWGPPGVSHVVVDKVHECSLQAVFLFF
jgi:HrpA-like RNA helicase